MAERSLVLDAITRVSPGSFIDARLSSRPENAIVYRTRQPLIDAVIEVPMLQEFGAFKVSALMSGRTQVGICVRFNDRTNAEVVKGDHARFMLGRTASTLGTPRTAMKTNDFLIFDFSSRNALLLKKLTKGRGYANDRKN